jgi:predicted nucleotidyltransferase
MNLAGLRLAFERNVRVALDSHTSVQVATTPVIVVLKIVAFLDRPAARHDDLGDIAQVFDRYLGPTEDRRWGLPTDFENASAFALGEDVGSVINEDELAIVSRFLDLSRDENDGHRTHALLIRNGPWEWRERPEVLFDRLNAFENGLGRRS